MKKKEEVVVNNNKKLNNNQFNKNQIKMHQQVQFNKKQNLNQNQNQKMKIHLVGEQVKYHKCYYIKRKQIKVMQKFY